MVDRQIRWKRVRSTEVIENDVNLLEYYILIVNESKEIRNIEAKIYSQLEPIIDSSQPILNSIPNTNGLMYKFIQFKSPKSYFNISKVYKGKGTWDRDLYPRQKDGVLQEYIENSLGVKRPNL